MDPMARSDPQLLQLQMPRTVPVARLVQLVLWVPSDPAVLKVLRDPTAHSDPEVLQVRLPLTVLMLQTVPSVPRVLFVPGSLLLPTGPSRRLVLSCLMVPLRPALPPRRLHRSDQARLAICLSVPGLLAARSALLPPAPR
jgi:hypothetical protein